MEELFAVSRPTFVAFRRTKLRGVRCSLHRLACTVHLLFASISGLLYK